ncbi:MAG TPA: transglycosylase SLT domain-containing protein [Longimicrobiaceae bacterium]|nr:transglycosylase SLT domain-containing protein [Longimicrobiaceae bacterium]
MMSSEDTKKQSMHRLGSAAAVMLVIAFACLVPSEDARAGTLQVVTASDTIPGILVAAVPSSVDVVIAPPPEEGRAAVYARRYRISKDLALQIIESAVAEGIDPELAFRLVRVESVFRANARGPRGALGLTQLMPSTARAVDRSLRTEADILEPAANLRTGFKYLRGLIERYKGDVRLGVLAYNRGETAVNRALRAGRDPENGYSRKVLGSPEDRYTGTGLLP